MAGPFHVMDDESTLVYEAADVDDAVRWWRENTRQGDYLRETGELISDLADPEDVD